MSPGEKRVRVRQTPEPRKNRLQRRNRTLRLVWLCAAAALALAALRPAPAAEVSRRPKPAPLTVAILDLAEAPELAPQAKPAPAQAPWRTSFGSERQTETETKVDPGTGPLAAIADSDAVLIQGVKAAAPLRRLFPPRIWRLIVSRGIVASGDPPDGEAEPTSAELPALTAIAVKARRTLRVTARALALRPGPTGSETEPADAESRPQAAVTAVRLVERGRALWIASIALPASCHGGEPDRCPAWSGLEAWRAAKRQAGDATLIGGRLPAKKIAERAAETPQACVSHRIDSDLETRILPTVETIPLSQTGAGCISIVRVGE
jgi:hypothetical protein